MSESDLMLSDAERRRFARYLEREAQTADGISTQIEKLGLPTGPLLAQRERAYAAACSLIARRLQATHSETI